MVACIVTTPQFSLKETGSLGKDSNVTMEIPVGTTLAYVLIELEIKHDGRFGEKPASLSPSPLRVVALLHLPRT